MVQLPEKHLLPASSEVELAGRHIVVQAIQLVSDLQKRTTYGRLVESSLAGPSW